MRDKRKKIFEKKLSAKTLGYFMTSMCQNTNYRILYTNILKKDGKQKIKEISSISIPSNQTILPSSTDIKIERIWDTLYTEKKYDKQKPE